MKECQIISFVTAKDRLVLDQLAEVTHSWTKCTVVLGPISVPFSANPQDLHNKSLKQPQVMHSTEINWSWSLKNQCTF